MARPEADILQGDWAGKKIGLLGGSFNPAHAAHVEISLLALKKLDLDAVWWLVSPQNPLKSEAGMAALHMRIERAQEMPTDGRIYVTDLERQLGSRYTIDTLKEIKNRLPDSHFVWLMGADNLAQFSQWKDWQQIGNEVVFAIFNRPGYSDALETSEAAQHFRDMQIPEAQAARLSIMPPPAWTFIGAVSNPLSSTDLRQNSI